MKKIQKSKEIELLVFYVRGAGCVAHDDVWEERFITVLMQSLSKRVHS
jgi:hypothetical protein